jgi:PAS domain S-box-containing protein
MEGGQMATATEDRTVQRAAVMPPDLEARAAFLQTALDNVSQAITVVDADLRLIAWNARFIELLNFPPDFAYWGRPFADFVRYNAERGEYGPGVPEDQVGERVALARKFLPHRFERTLPNGTVIEVCGNPIPGGGFVTTYSDVTEQKRAETALRESEERTRLIIETALDAVVVMDSAGIIVGWNAQAERIFGWPAEDAVGQTLAATIIPPKLREAHERGLRRFLSTGEGPALNRRLEVLARRRDGLEFPVELTITPAQCGGRLLFSAFLRDITERQRAERALRDSEARYRDLVEGSIQGLYIQKDHVIQFANAAAAHTFGFETPEDLVGKNALTLYAPEERLRLESYAAARMRNESAPTRYEVRALRTDGSAIWLELLVSVVQWQGEPAILATLIDTTDRKLAEEALRRSEQQLRQSQKMEAVGRLAGGIAHDFNNLLTVITGRSELALLSPRLAPGLHRDILLIQSTAERAASLTRQLLAFSRQQVLQPKVLDLNAVVTHMGGMLRRLIGEDIDLVIVAHPPLGSVNADPGQLEQVVMNLALNARDAMPAGGQLTIETADVELEGQHELPLGAHVMLAVSDTGCGMDADTQARIFEPFYTTKAPGQGTGLGLATVYGIVQQSGGHIVVTSEPGCGSMFRIYLPRVAAPADLVPETEDSPAEPRGSETVLLVEDENDLRMLARDILTAQGYKVLEAGDGIEALRIAHESGGEIQLLLTDVVMPQMGGAELAESLMAATPLKILFMSGYTDSGSACQQRMIRSAPFLQKPFTCAGLVRKVREVLDGAPSMA